MDGLEMTPRPPQPELLAHVLAIVESYNAGRITMHNAGAMLMRVCGLTYEDARAILGPEDEQAPQEDIGARMERIARASKLHVRLLVCLDSGKWNASTSDGRSGYVIEYAHANDAHGALDALEAELDRRGGK